MAVNALAKGLMLAILLLTEQALAETIYISSQPGDGPIDVQGSASVQRQADGVLITFNRLTVAARFRSGEPLYITALRFNGSDVTGSGMRTSLMFSERAPIGKWLAPSEVLSLDVPTPIFMRQPGWHQHDPRFNLHVEIRIEGKDGFLPVPTTLHELKLASDFSRRGNSEVREIKGASSTLPLMPLSVAILAYWGFVHWCSTPRKEALVGLLLMLFVWGMGIYPMARYVNSLMWVRAEAQIVDSDVRDVPPVGKQKQYRYAPVVKYQYEFEGSRYSSTQLQLWAEETYASRNEAWLTLQSWDTKRVEGSPVTVWINPSNPSDAVLSRQYSFWQVLVCMFGLVGLVVLWLRKKPHE